MTDKPYRYTECGLNYIYLLDGYQILNSARGRIIRVTNAGKLDRAIALAIVRRQKQLTGQEVRFLRGLLDMTQEALGRTLGVDAKTVATWERGKTKLPSTEDIAIRQIYLELTMHRQKFVETSRKIRGLGERAKRFTFRASARPNVKALAWLMVS